MTQWTPVKKKQQSIAGKLMKTQVWNGCGETGISGKASGLGQAAVQIPALDSDMY
jgi:hypothetical protein